MPELSLEERLARYAEEDRREAAKEKKEKEQHQKDMDVFVRSMAGMYSMSLAEKANTQLALLTQGVLECMALSTLVPPPANGDPKSSTRRAELQDAARLSTASARVLEALTRHQYQRSKRRVFQSVIKKPCPDGSFAHFTVRDITPIISDDNEFAMDQETIDAVVAKSRAAANENAKAN